jgi:hypothetical protein
MIPICPRCLYPKSVPYMGYFGFLCNCQDWQTYTTMPNSSPNLPVGESRVREIAREEIIAHFRSQQVPPKSAIPAINPKETP